MLYIHAGMGKTGTTSIQHFAKNEVSLREFFNYPLSGLQGDGHHLLALNKQKRQNWVALIDEICSRETINDSLKPYFISTENLFFEDADFLKELRRMLDSRKISHKIIIGYRAFKGYALSTYLEYVSQGRIPIYSTYEQFLDDHLQSIRYDNTLSRFRDIFGHCIIYYNFDEGRQVGLLKSFFETWLKPFPCNVDKTSSAIKNPSLTLKGSIIANVIALYLDKIIKSKCDVFTEHELLEDFFLFSKLTQKISLDQARTQHILEKEFTHIVKHVMRRDVKNRIFNLPHINTTQLFNQIADIHNSKQLSHSEQNFNTPCKYKALFEEIEYNKTELLKEYR